MIGALLLVKADKEIRHQDISRTVLQCLHGLQSIERALSIFHSIISDLYNKTQPSFVVAGAFDAHVGDCACHMRAQMLWDIIGLYKTPEKMVLLERAIALLGELRVDTAVLLQQMGKRKGNMGALGFGSKVTFADVFRVIGFTRFLSLAEDASNTSGTSTPAAPGTPGSILSQLDEANERIQMDLIHRSQSSSPNSSSSSSISSIRSSSSSHSHRSLAVDTEWNPDNFLTVVRFLTLSRLLSDSKKATLEPGPPARVIARVEPTFSYAQSEKELESLNLIGDVSLSSVLRPADKEKKNSLVNECELMQIYIAQLTTSWTKRVATDMGLSSTSRGLCDRLAVTNARQISCVASYISMLLIRAIWLTRGTPVLMVIQRFCSHGYHNIFHRITKKSTVWKSPTERKIEAMGEDDWFDITPVSEDEVLSSSWSGESHVVLICISGQGRTEDFYNRLVEANQARLGYSHPHNGPCCELDEYVDKIQHMNFSHVLMYIFAQHEQFPFALPDKQDGFEYVAELLENWLGEEASKIFMTARTDADSFGTGRSVELYTLQHVYLELAGVVGRQVRDMVDRKEKPAVIGYRWA